ncbi:MAG: PTS mannose/fructose/sorbose transporter subunit IIC [Atopobiaceae bacterium]|nr:PTS mannose/fructose/sorbose transporter subunit IIC [Atopobiaceae bacterium]
MNPISIILVFLIAFLAGLEGILDEWQFHQPIVACTLIGVATGHLQEGAILGASLQLIALGWMNVGAAVAPDAALASVAAGILVCMKGVDIGTGQASAMALAVAGLMLTTLIRTVSVGIVHMADAAAEKGNIRGVEMPHFIALFLQGMRIAIPALLVMMVPVGAVQAALEAIPSFVTTGLSVAGGFVVVVGYAMVINMMATPKLWPFFFIGFGLAVLTNITLIGMGLIGVALALIYIDLSPEFNNTGGSGGGAGGVDPLDAILNDYE